MYTSHSLEVDSLLMKVSACVPVFGVLPTLMASAFLDEQLKNNTLSNQQKIRLLDLKNQYRIASIIRDMIGLAFIIKTIAFGVLTPKILFSIALVAVFTIWHIHSINEHNLLIERIRQVARSGLNAVFH